MKIKEQHKNIVGASLVFIGAILFSAKAVMVKISYGYHVDAITILMLRMVFSLPFYLVIFYFNKHKIKEANLTRKDWITIFAMGIIGYYMASIFDFIGLQYVTAGVERLILFIYPTLVVIISAIFLGKKISAKSYIALALTYAGIAFVFMNDLSFEQKGIWFGVMCIFGSALTYAIYLIGSGELIPKLGVVCFTSLSMMISSVTVIIHYMISKDISQLDLSKEVVYLGISMAVFSTVIPSFLISAGIGFLGSSRASIVASVGPVSTIVLAYFFLDENFSFTQLAGTILVLFGVFMVSTSKAEVQEKKS